MLYINNSNYVLSFVYLDSYDINDIDYNWKAKEDVIILDAEMSEFELSEASSERKPVKYVIGINKNKLCSLT